MVDARDLKSLDRKIVPVRFRFRAPDCSPLELPCNTAQRPCLLCSHCPPLEPALTFRGFLRDTANLGARPRFLPAPRSGVCPPQAAWLPTARQTIMRFPARELSRAIIGTRVSSRDHHGGQVEGDLSVIGLSRCSLRTTVLDSIEDLPPIVSAWHNFRVPAPGRASIPS